MSVSRTTTICLAEKLCEIDRLAQLPAGWDSNGADRPDPEAVSASRTLLQRIVESDLGLSCPAVVTASRGGGIQFEWGSHDSTYFELECLSADHVEYYFCDVANQIEKEGAIIIHGNDFPEEIADYILQASQRD